MSSSKSARCFRCGEHGHIVDDCSLDEDVCFVCKESGHVKDQCPRKTKQNVNSARCFRCGERGHIGDDCSLDEGVCFVCKESGHVKDECPRKTKQNAKSARCFRCGEHGHIVADCSLDEGVCYVCKESGHVKDECPRKTKQNAKSVRCFRCGERGHIVDDCSLDEGVCYVCKESGHVKDECPRKTKQNAKLVRCFRCGERGHIVDDCSLDEGVCFVCKESGHVKDECPRKTKQNAKKQSQSQCHTSSATKEKIRCVNCHDRGHLSTACPLVEDVCDFCNQTGHLRMDCVLKTCNDQHSAQQETKQHEASQRQQNTTPQGYAFAQEKDMRVNYPHNFHSGYVLQPPLGYQGFIPPLHALWPLPGPALPHPGPFGHGIHPTPVPFPSDTPLEIMEQKLASQCWEMQRLAAENQRFAAVYSSLKQELAAAQQELQRLQNQMDAVKTGKDQQLKLFLDKVAKMEADLKASESVKVELQQAHAKAQRLAATRQELLSQVQQMNQDLQRRRGDDQQILALMSELEVLREEYQCCRETYDNECKLRIGHYESLQAMEKNFDSMIRELEQLHAELSNATIIDKSAAATLGGQFVINADADKENVASGRYHARQILYEDGYEKVHAGVAAPYRESAAGSVSSEAVYNASIVPRDDFLGITGNDGPQGTHAYLTSGYAARPAGVTLSATGLTAAARDSTWAPPSYGAAQQAAYGTGRDYEALCGGSNAPR